MLFRKSLFACLVTAAVGTAAVASGPGCVVNHAGFKMGVGLGMNNTNAKYDVQTVNPGTAFIGANTHNKMDSGKAGFFGDIFGGYGHTFGNVYAGLELSLHSGSPWINIDKKGGESQEEISGRPWNVQVKQTYGGTLAPVFGLIVNPNVLLYTKIGVDYSQYKMRVSHTQIADSGNASLATLDTYLNQAPINKKKSKAAFFLALGTDILLNQNFFVRLEGSALFGPKLTSSEDFTRTNPGLTSAPSAFPYESITHKAKITQYAFKVGFGYKIGK